MADIKWKAGNVVSDLTTELNSLATAGGAISSALDNTSNLDLFADFEVALQYTSSAPTAGTIVAEIYLLPASDGTNYPTGTSSIKPQGALLIGVVECRNPSTSALEYSVIPGVPLPPSLFKILLWNTSGKTLASSGNFVKHLPYKQQVV